MVSAVQSTGRTSGLRTVTMDTDPSSTTTSRTVLIECYDSVAEKWALFPGVS
jgi:hypothetical protein